MKILNADTSNRTDKFSNDNVYDNCTKEVNSNKNKVYMSQHDEVHESQNENDSMNISVVHNLPNKECDKRAIYLTQTFFHYLNEIETWKDKKNKTLKRGKYFKK